MLDFDVLNYDPDTPGFYVILLSTLFSFFLSSLIAITYQLTTKSIYRRAHFLQALVLISMVAAMIMQAIGDSVARGLGILGALSIIRFRTVLDDPRNITFMFASLGVGIAAGVLGFTVALTSTLVFCLAAFILYLSPLSDNNELIGELRLQVLKEDHLRATIETAMDRYCRDYELEKLRYLNPKRMKNYTEQGLPVVEEISREDLQEFTYLVRLRPSATLTELTAGLEEIEGLEDLRLNFQQRQTKL
ncbi:hypothetical protein LEM8419_01000 [Neolewinella maritima]|uniref:DUF4956 domain-containing protein n=1 Tax=Neolewinella maritima TaxID=1383882 RepID=A0ABM9AY97_9BACT|nr:DUF4956 domain-containing protein [Neolewinella maritima]CAH0999700.1 hypothetical protein LEM8419_01000 [Neolewinella maritima]